MSSYLLEISSFLLLLPYKHFEIKILYIDEVG
jgi:hypothetical protein